jgi:hypothetical protein
MAPARSVSVVVPAFNEEKNLEPAVRDIVDAAAELDEVEVLIVDDGSTDATLTVAEGLAREFPQVSVIKHQRNQGFGAAYLDGLRQARLRHFTSAPGDHEINIESLRDMFRAVGTADLVVPYHATPQERTWFRRFLTRACTLELNCLFGWRLRYYQGPTIYPTTLARAIPVLTHGFFLPTVMLAHALAAGYTITEVGLRHQERAYGRSKAVSVGNILVAERTILRLWWLLCIRRSRWVADAGSARPGAVAALHGSDQP